jgi:hypothetical protein
MNSARRRGVHHAPRPTALRPLRVAPIGPSPGVGADARSIRRSACVNTVNSSTRTAALRDGPAPPPVPSLVIVTEHFPRLQLPVTVTSPTGATSGEGSPSASLGPGTGLLSGVIGQWTTTVHAPSCRTTTTLPAGPPHADRFGAHWLRKQSRTRREFATETSRRPTIPAAGGSGRPHPQIRLRHGQPHHAAGRGG